MKKILIANRGEIAVRILRSIRESGYSPVAIYSDADRSALHVRLSDEAHYVGPSPSKESYLNIDRILEIAKAAKVAAIHPGYGFLSENSAFARACKRENIVFIGPSAKAMEDMGDKIRARTVAEKANLPMVPASSKLENAKDAKAWAKKIGYPVLLKAKAGGGGKGMRRVHRDEEMEEAYRLAESEALQSFGNGDLYIEKYIVRSRHIEVQIFGDQQGNVLALGDRECSIQRRHQKIIEEAPAPNLKEATRQLMASASRDLGKMVHYEGAGTIEYLVDENEKFYFLEMNTRLQVEHPVTELTTGLDLVAWQIAVAFGQPLPLRQEEIALSGHAIETRLYAEDPDQSFYPSPGTIESLHWPNGPGIRIDSGVEAGTEISLYYDPMIAKVSIWGENRSHAVKRLERVLGELRVRGVKTNLHFLQRLILHEKFQKGELWTTFVQDEGPFSRDKITGDLLDAALAASCLFYKEARPNEDGKNQTKLWWQSGLPLKARLSLE